MTTHLSIFIWTTVVIVHFFFLSLGFDLGGEWYSRLLLA
jgi:hypothetical protein